MNATAQISIYPLRQVRLSPAVEGGASAALRSGLEPQVGRSG
jgi:hypothetical protein